MTRREPVVHARTRWTRGALRALGVLGLCVGIALGVVSPSNAAVGWSPSSSLAGTCSTPATDKSCTLTITSVSMTAGHNALSYTLTAAPNGGDFANFMGANSVEATSDGGTTWGSAGISSGGIFQCVPNGSGVCSGTLNGTYSGTANGLRIGLGTPMTSVLMTYGQIDAGAPAGAATGACSLADVQLVGLARAAGFGEPQIQTAVAVALAESSGVVNAVHHNTSDGSYDLGLWQINDDAHPSLDRDRLVNDPLYNATAALSVYSASSSWSPWVTYTSGAYSQYMLRASMAIDQAGPGTLPMTSCTGALGNPSAGDASSDPGAGCTGWNPLTYFKCALRWAFVPGEGSGQQWTAFVDNVHNRAPLSYAYAAVATAQSGVDFLSPERVQACDQVATPCANDASFADGMPGMQTTPAGGSIWLSVHDLAANPVVAGLRLVLGFAVYVGGGWLIVHRVRASFGGRG